MKEVNHAGATEATRIVEDYPEPSFPARYDFEAWCYHHRHTRGRIGEAARFVLNDTGRDCWTPTRQLEPFYYAHHGRGAQGRADIFIEHLTSEHGAGLDSPLIKMVADAHRLYLKNLQTFWARAERVPGRAPNLDALLDFSERG